jgi:hypothetical protein
MGPGNGAVGAAEVLLDLPPKMLLKVCWVTELRRCLPSMGGLLRSLLDMVGGCMGFELSVSRVSFDIEQMYCRWKVADVG